MSSPFLAEIKLFGGNFAPRGYALCNGQLLAISQNTALFSLLGTTYGGDGRSTFGLPDFRGRVPIEPRQGPGLSLYNLGQVGGAISETMSLGELPAHTHTPLCLSASPNPAPLPSPSGNVWAIAGSRRVATNLYKASPPATTANMNSGAVGLTGGGQPHNNLQPFLTVTFIIALQGIYPARN